MQRNDAATASGATEFQNQRVQALAEPYLSADDRALTIEQRVCATSPPGMREVWVPLGD